MCIRDRYLEPVMRDIEAMLESSQRNVNGTAILELHPLCFSTVGVESDDDLVTVSYTHLKTIDSYLLYR